MDNFNNNFNSFNNSFCSLTNINNPAHPNSPFNSNNSTNHKKDILDYINKNNTCYYDNDYKPKSKIGKICNALVFVVIIIFLILDFTVNIILH